MMVTKLFGDKRQLDFRLLRPSTLDSKFYWSLQGIAMGLSSRESDPEEEYEEDV